MKIDRVHVKTVDNGYIVDYFEDKVHDPYGWQSKSVVFRTWAEVVTWMGSINLLDKSVS